MVAYAINCVHTYSIFPLRILKLNPRNFFWNSWKKCKSRTESNDSEGGCRGEAVRCEICAFRSLIPIDLTQTLNWKWVAICSKSTFLNKIQSNFEEQKAKRSKIPPATRSWSIYRCLPIPNASQRPAPAAVGLYRMPSSLMKTCIFRTRVLKMLIFAMVFKRKTNVLHPKHFPTCTGRKLIIVVTKYSDGSIRNQLYAYV